MKIQELEEPNTEQIATFPNSNSILYITHIMATSILRGSFENEYLGILWLFFL